MTSDRLDVGRARARDTMSNTVLSRNKTPLSRFSREKRDTLFARHARFTLSLPPSLSFSLIELRRVQMTRLRRVYPIPAPPPPFAPRTISLEFSATLARRRRAIRFNLHKSDNSFNAHVIHSRHTSLSLSLYLSLRSAETIKLSAGKGRQRVISPFYSQFSCLRILIIETRTVDEYANLRFSGFHPRMYL